MREGGLMRDRRKALAIVPVSRETEERLDTFVQLLDRWNTKTNLASQATFVSVWTRHVADSAQIHLLSPKTTGWLDIGSGAGFPGIVLAIQLADLKGVQVHCVESDQRKCAFLREVARATCAPAIIHSCRIQSLAPSDIGAADGVTARAFAPLSLTLDVASRWLEAGALGVFPRGSTVTKQLENLRPPSTYDLESIPSVIDVSASFLKVQLG